MLHRIDISNYRGFSSYQMEGLARVNLLVGKNNSGKTALLEGIQFLTSGGDPAVLAEVAERRGELIVTPSDARTYPGRDLSVDISHFFHGHVLAPEQPISLTGDNGYPPVKLRVVPLKEHAAGAGRTSLSTADRSRSFLKIEGPATRGGDEERGFRITREGAVDIERVNRLGRRVGARPQALPAVRFVGPDSLNSIDMAVMWDEITLKGGEADVASAMRILEPDLSSVHLLTGMFASGYFPARGGIVVGMKNQEGRVPLGTMGDGRRRIMALATALAFTRGGCLFVDEIDTGLHYSVMAQMWKLIIDKANASDIQVFATTHSWDCIEGLSLHCQGEPSAMGAVAIHKIDRAIRHSVPFSGDSIVRMVKADIDPR